jgi:hypothetical protein
MRKYLKEIIIGIIIMISVVMFCSINIKKNQLKTIDKELKWKGMDAYSFKETFRYMYNQHGEDWIFEWRGNKYKTILKEGK